MQFDGFDWDDGNWPKCARHGLTKAEIELVLRSDPQTLPDRNPNLSETRYNAVGMNRNGRHVFVVFTFRFRNDLKLLRPISARYMHRKEISRYERR